MLELTPGNRPSAQACLANQSISMRQLSPSRFEPGTDVAATEVLSKQSTKILLPLADSRGGWDRPTTPQKSSKRLQFSKCSAELQVDNSQKQFFANYYFRLSPASRNLETNCCKIYIVIEQIDFKTIAKLQTVLFDNIDKKKIFLCSDKDYAEKEKNLIALN